MTILEQIIRHSQELPESLQDEALDFIIFLEKKYLAESVNSEQVEFCEQTENEQLLAIMEEGAKLNLFSQWGDPVAWQKEIRQDRKLLGR